MRKLIVNPIHAQRFREALKDQEEFEVESNAYQPAWRIPAWWRRWFLRSKPTIPVLEVWAKQ